MADCGKPHPDTLEITCSLPSGHHPEHLGGFPPDFVIWPNDDFIHQASGDPLDVFRNIVKRVKGSSYSDIDPYP